jgi:hypothetical protein
MIQSRVIDAVLPFQVTDYPLSSYKEIMANTDLHAHSDLMVRK